MSSSPNFHDLGNLCHSSLTSSDYPATQVADSSFILEQRKLSICAHHSSLSSHDWAQVSSQIGKLGSGEALREVIAKLSYHKQQHFSRFHLQVRLPSFAPIRAIKDLLCDDFSCSSENIVLFSAGIILNDLWLVRDIEGLNEEIGLIIRDTGQHGDIPMTTLSSLIYNTTGVLHDRISGRDASLASSRKSMSIDSSYLPRRVVHPVSSGHESILSRDTTSANESSNAFDANSSDRPSSVDDTRPTKYPKCTKLPRLTTCFAQCSAFLPTILVDSVGSVTREPVAFFDGRSTSSNGRKLPLPVGSVTQKLVATFDGQSASLDGQKLPLHQKICSSVDIEQGHKSLTASGLSIS